MPNLDNDKIEILRDLALQYGQGQQDFKVLENLGAGASAAVFKIVSAKGTTALKVHDPEFSGGWNNPAEQHRLKLQQSLIGKKEPFLAEIYNVEAKLNTCFIEMEYCPWENMKKVLSEIPSEKIENLVMQLVACVAFFEENNLVHRDIKPENILISPDFDSLKLIDYGILRDFSKGDDDAQNTDHGKKKPFIATAQYSSPEYLFRLTEPSENLWKGLTIYQVGAVLYDLLQKSPIFNEEVESDNRYKLAWAVLNKTPLLSKENVISNERLAKLCSHCLVKDLDYRLSLVSWDDFRPESGDNVSRLKKNLQKLKASSSHSQQSSVYQRLLSEKRNTLIESFKDAVKGELLSSFGTDLQIVAKIENAHISFVAHVPSCELSITARIDISWQNELENSKGHIKLTCLNPKSVENNESSEIGEADLGGGNFDVNCKNLVQGITRIINFELESKDL